MVRRDNETHVLLLSPVERELGVLFRAEALPFPRQATGPKMDLRNLNQLNSVKVKRVLLFMMPS